MPASSRGPRRIRMASRGRAATLVVDIYECAGEAVLEVDHRDAEDESWSRLYSGPMHAPGRYVTRLDGIKSEVDLGLGAGFGRVLYRIYPPIWHKDQGKQGAGGPS